MIINFKILKYIKIIFKISKQCVFNAHQNTIQHKKLSRKIRLMLLHFCSWP